MIILMGVFFNFDLCFFVLDTKRGENGVYTTHRYSAETA
jgi:hypothetical protein